MTQHQTGKNSQGTSSGKKSTNSGNFKNNPEKASEAGRKGGEHSHSGTQK